MSDKKGGCGLILAVVMALMVIVGAALLAGKLAEYNDAEASRLYARGALEESYARAQGEIIRAESQARLDQAVAEAQMVLAQGQARLDSAQAFAVTAGASLPWLVVAVVGVAGVVLLACIVAIFGLSLAAIRGQQSWHPWQLERPTTLILPPLNGWQERQHTFLALEEKK